MNYKIILGVSSVTLLSLIYYYIRNLFKPQTNKLVKAQELRHPDVLPEPPVIRSMDFTAALGKLDDIIANFRILHTTYLERISQNLFPTYISKRIVHYSSIEDTQQLNLGRYKVNLAPNHNKMKSPINIRLLSAQIPYVPHNIYDGDDHSTYRKIGLEGGLDGFSIPEGKYTIYTLINYINGQCAKLNFSINPVTNYISIFNTSKTKCTLGSHESYPLFKRLGIDDSTSIPNGSHITCSSLPDLSIHFIDIKVPKWPGRQTEVVSDTIIKRIPLTLF